MIHTLSMTTIIYTSLTILRQMNLKKIITYSLVAHMNIVTIGMFSLNIQGIGDSILVCNASQSIEPLYQDDIS